MNTPKQYEKLGIVAELMCKSDMYCSFPVACLKLWIEPPILLDQIKFFTDFSGNYVGYMTWALLSSETLDRVINDSDTLLHLSEWNEGNNLFIVDLVAINSDLARHLKQVKEEMHTYEVASSLRRGADGSVRKVTTWHAHRFPFRA